ncbi:hypothetical protein FisN_4Lh047 [Fistulifera solaris]|uniref:PAS domain-containing protein n=1 Tax=Fistulifera solaris TaxID=1519565 RepID=A0A1Z5KDP8_FISSO|nr:hypothetical protein FisN_4Lh047 [Fistulifera solaris]|eukprot:GAX24252.1 hypothetical protein FisN_4Lh047 [Fistulifera solaris]
MDHHQLSEKGESYKGSRQGLASAPVSSLLPPIPSSIPAPSLQAQLLAFVANKVYAAPTPRSSAEEAVANLLTAATAGGLTGGSQPFHSLTQAQPTTIRDWTVEKLEKHVKLLTQLQQPVPPNISIMLSEMKRREEKKHAKRLANRKSASTSRARKKALVQEMTELNTRLKRQALILSLLPDLVIVVNLDGVVTFCNEQVERVLSHKGADLVGTKLVNILVPSSRRRLENLMKTLSKSIHREAISETALNERNESTRPGPNLNCAEEAGASQEVAEISSSDVAACAAGQSIFPLSVVQVATHPQEGSSSSGGGLDENENSDESGGNAEGKDSKQASSLTNSGTISGSSSLRPQLSSCLDNNGFDSVSMMKDKPASDSAIGAKVKSSKDSASCDISNTSSLSTLKKLRNANDNLIINVRWHNRNIKDNKKAGTFKDDVTGDDVTANNASARLSSLRHHRESSSEEDSGYRESNESREETSSSTSDLSDSNGRRKPVAPTCNLCLIRADMSTIRCEVTSSIQSRYVDDDLDDDMKSKKAFSGSDTDTAHEIKSESSASKEPIVEILLCIRPIRDGTVRVGKKQGMKKVRLDREGTAKTVSDSNMGEGTSQDTSNSSQESSRKQSHSQKKRLLEEVSTESDQLGKKGKLSSEPEAPNNDAVESLMSMSCTKTL